VSTVPYRTRVPAPADNKLYLYPASTTIGLSLLDVGIIQKYSYFSKRLLEQQTNNRPVIKKFPKFINTANSMNNTSRPMARLKMRPDGRIYLDAPQEISDVTAPTQPDQDVPLAAAAAPRECPQQRVPLLGQAPEEANASENPFVAFQNHPAMAEPEFLQSLLMSTLPLQGLTGIHQGVNVIGAGPQRFTASASVLSPAVFPPALFPAVQQQSRSPVATKLATPQEPSGEFTKVPHREPASLYLECDDQNLSPYQCLIRKQIEFFQASEEEIDGTAQGRNTPIVLGQVGIRCRHCAMLSPQNRRAGAVYFPRRVRPRSTSSHIYSRALRSCQVASYTHFSFVNSRAQTQLNGVYQTAQNMAAGHILKKCTNVPESDRKNTLMLKEKKSSAGGGREYWSNAAGVMGILETAHGLRFLPRKGSA
jgi:hypothetical protein